MEVDNEVKENEQSDNEEDTNSKQNSQENEAKDNVNSEGKDTEKEHDEEDAKNEKKGSKTQKEVENDTKSEDTSEKEDNENDDKKSVPLLDQPLEISGTRERKKVQRFNDDFPRDSKEVCINEHVNLNLCSSYIISHYYSFPKITIFDINTMHSNDLYFYT